LCRQRRWITVLSTIYRMPAVNHPGSARK
jgi:hypothetical protein